MTVSRVSLIVSLLLLTAAAPEVPSGSKAPELPPTVALQTLAPREAMPVLGQRVVEPDGKAVARLVDVLVDPDGRPVAAVLDFGGFMGVGIRKIAVHWSTLQFEPGEDTHRIVLTLAPDEIKAAPEYRDPGKAAPVVVPEPPKPGPESQ
jgi:PRC-barrel domain